MHLLSKKNKFFFSILLIFEYLTDVASFLLIKSKFGHQAWYEKSKQL